MDSTTLIEPGTIEQLEQWFATNAGTETAVGVIIYKKSSGKQMLNFAQILEVAIANGWIDTKTKTVDEERYAIFLVQRKNNSHWTPGNIEIAQRLIRDGRMTDFGLSRLPKSDT